MKNGSAIWPIKEFPRSSSVKGQKTRAVVGVRFVTTKIGVQPDRYNSPKTAAGG
jgi:hypothetical protein